MIPETGKRVIERAYGWMAPLEGILIEVRNPIVGYLRADDGKVFCVRPKDCIEKMLDTTGN